MIYAKFRFEELQQEDVEEIVEFEDDYTDEDIAEEYEAWMNSHICDRAKWHRCDDQGNPL